MNIIRGFPGDDPMVAYPMYEREYGGDAAVATLQLHVSKISPERASALTKAWHPKPMRPIQLILGRYSTYGAEYNNRYYGVAVWGQNDRSNYSQRLHKIAISATAPEDTLRHLFLISSQLFLAENPLIKRLSSNQLMPAVYYEEAGWQRTKGEKNAKRAAPSWFKSFSEPRPKKEPEPVPQLFFDVIDPKAGQPF